MTYRFVRKISVLSRRRFFQIRRDRKKKIGLFLMMLGLLIFIFGYKIEYEPMLSDAVISASALVTSCILMFSGIYGLYWDKVTSRRMKWIDFIWMLGTSVGVFFGVAQALLSPSDQFRSEAKEIDVRFRKIALLEIERSFYLACNSTNPLPLSVCNGIRDIYGRLKVGDNFYKWEFSKVCPEPPYEFFDKRIDPRIGILCSRLAPIVSRHPTSYAEGADNHLGLYAGDDQISQHFRKIMDNEDDLRYWNLIKSIMPIFISIILGARVAKSVTELFWFEDGKAKKS